MCVLADCVPSKTFIATSEAMTTLSHADRVGVHGEGTVRVEVAEVHARVKALALAQSSDIAANLVRHGVSILHGPARLLPGKRVQVGTQNFVEPHAAVRILKELEDFCASQKISDVNELIFSLRL